MSEWANHSFFLSESLICSFAHKNERFAQKLLTKIVFLYVLLKKRAICSFPLFFWAMWANPWGHSPKMSNVSEALRPLTKNEQPWAIRSGLLPKMSNHEQIAKGTHQKSANERIIFFLAIRSFFRNKQAIRSEIWWANSQPCKYVTKGRSEVKYNDISLSCYPNNNYMLIFEYVFINIVRVQTQCSLIGIAKKLLWRIKKIVIMKRISKGR